ncbi:MAG: UDP-N-acetylmuramoyl-tripeptide--D-alanyl-D-alanine ligase [Odoribacter sp.]|nr:UDP-N-acetylmuramoyl-tripeptide--D-alanyl-D-alanine ligase [Odoribacter sp.]
MEISDIYSLLKGHRVTTDTRNVVEGDVFFALKGENFDGNSFAQQAIESGAYMAIIDNPKYASLPRTLLVENVLHTLQQVAAYHRHKLGIPILGITGTNGKTTTKELCHAVISKKMNCVATKGNLNNHIGVPLTLLSMNETTQFGIVEMGANHPGEIEFLCNIANPDYGLITNIGEAHIEGFGSKEMIIETKTALYRHVAAKQGKLFVNSSDELLMRKSAQIERETYGDTGTIAKGELVQSIPNMVLDLHTPLGHRYIKTKLIGGYNYHNAMAAIALGKFLDINDETIAQAIEEYTPGNMRSQLIKSKSNTIILDAYNANPTSMTVAVTNFANMQHPNKIVILGEMRELGHREAEAHAELVNLVLEQNFSKIYFVGKPFENHKDRATNIIWTQNTEGLIELLKEEKPENSIIFVKGSRGNRLERIVEHL